MSNSGKITTLLLLLIFIFAMIGALFSYQYNLDVDMSKFISDSTEKNQSASSYSYIEVYKDKKIVKNNVIVSDRFTGSIEDGAQVIVVGNDGSLYNIKEGVLLVDDNIVVSNDETYSIQQVDNLEMIVSTK